MPDGVKEPAVGYRAQSRWLRVDPQWFFLLGVVILAALSVLGLANSGMREGFVGLIGGCWLITLIGFAIYLKRKKGLED